MHASVRKMYISTGKDFMVDSYEEISDDEDGNFIGDVITTL